MKKYNLEGKYVLITGASSGIGKELARCFAEAGSHCVIHSIPGDRDALLEWGGELEKRFSVRVWCMVEDFSKEQGPVNLYRNIAEKVPRIDVLVNNAGMMAYGNVHEVSLESQIDLVRVNICGYLSLMRLFIPDMLLRDGGRVLNISSVSAFQPSPHHAVYGASKSFIQSLSEAASQELKGTGVLVTAFCPSYTNTPLLRVNGFPANVWWYRISGLSDPADIARKAMRALVKGKAVVVPGLMSKFVHLFLNRFLPRSLVVAISNFVLRKSD
jgi:uncharacterized protein